MEITGKYDITIAIVGHGTVGSATSGILEQLKKQLAQRSSVRITLKYIVVRQSPQNSQKSLPYTTDFKAVLQDDDVDCIVELAGGIDGAYNIIKESLAHGKHVVTANKALLALHGAELWGLARENERVIAFEASCGGGIPIIRALTDGLLANSIDAIYGIVNGTCNYILSHMAAENISYEDALKLAQGGGMAEADPRTDISGLDSGHKIAIMSSLSFGLRVDFNKIMIQGIENIGQVDMLYARDHGYKIKLLAGALRTAEGISIWVRPSLLERKHPLAWIDGSFNGISVYGNINGHSLYYGRGAGGRPTASAVISDIIAVALGHPQITFKATNYWQDRNSWEAQPSIEDTLNRYYLRLHSKENMLPRILDICKEEKIPLSLEPVVTGENIIITTDMVLEKEMLAAQKRLETELALQQSTCMLIHNEHEEQMLPL